MPIPNDLIQFPNWVVWRLETVGDKITKVPYNARTGRKADTTNPETWSTYEAAHACSINGGNYNGVGYVLSADDPFTFVDLDPNDDETTQARQKEIFDALPSYAEFSPSGHGVHIICRGKVPSAVKYGKIELYSQERYMTVTGNTWRDLPITDCTPQLLQLHAALTAHRQRADTARVDSPEKYTDEYILQMANNAANGDKFRALWAAQPGTPMPVDSVDKSDSVGDQALVNMLWFYSRNREQVKRLWFQTPLGRRDKVQSRPKYIDGTIDHAMDRDIPVGAMVLPPIQSSAFTPTPTPPLIEATSVDAFELGPIELPGGLFGEITRYIYSKSPFPNQKVAIAGAIGFMSGLCGRAYNVRGSGLNTYTLVLGASGVGKNAMHDGITHIVRELATMVPSLQDFFDVGEVASGQALYREIRKQKSLLIRMYEFAHELARMTGKYVQPNMILYKRAILQLHSESGRHGSIRSTIFADADKKGETIYAPALSILAESATKELYSLLTHDLVANGLLPRFIVLNIPNSEWRLDENEAREQIRMDEDTRKLISNLALYCLQLNQKNEPLDVLFSPEAIAWLPKFKRRLRAAADPDKSEELGELWNRAPANIVRLAALLAVGDSIYMPTITVKHLEWAATIVEAGVQHIRAKFVSGEVGGNNHESKAYQDLIRFLVRYTTHNGEPLPKQHYSEELWRMGHIRRSYLQVNMRPRASFRHLEPSVEAGFDRVLKNAVDNGALTTVEQGVFRINSLILNNL